MSDLLSLHSESRSSPPNTIFVGAFGERLAADYLQAQGYRLVLANFKVPVGRNSRDAIVTGEIDLIALENETVCFVEVKTRSSDQFASPLAAVDVRKQRQITRTARVYRQIFNLAAVKFRYDVVSIVLDKTAEPRIELFRNYWTEAKFRKKSWDGEIY